VKASRRVDTDDQLFPSPPGLRFAWIVLLALVALEAVNEIGHVGGTAAVYQIWIHEMVIAASALLVLLRGVYEPTNRRAWLVIGLAMAFWCAGGIAWSAVYGGQSSVPYPTFADILWLAWYPLMVVGIAMLIRQRFANFELHRWLDGLAVTLLVLVIGFALIIEPTTDETTQGMLAKVVDFSYPVLDVLLIGTVLGVYALLGWRPDRMWLFIGLGIAATTGADAAFAVQQAHGVGTDENYAFVWTLGALCIAYAAWTQVPASSHENREVTGMRAIALPLVAQALAAGIQVYAIFNPVGKSERIVTLAVLAVSSVQIILTRPRPQEAAQKEEGPEDPPSTSSSLSRSVPTRARAAPQVADAGVARPVTPSDPAGLETQLIGRTGTVDSDHLT
jgi:hypothetical protein